MAERRSRKVRTGKNKRAEENDEYLLPHNWVKSIETKDGFFIECYKNRETGQTFHSEEDYTRYLHYVTQVRPRLREERSECPDRIYKKAKGQKDTAGRSSSDPTDGVDRSECPEQHRDKKGKGKMDIAGDGSSDPVDGLEQQKTGEVSSDPVDGVEQQNTGEE